MSFLDRALRMGEGKKFKGYESRVAKIADYEDEMVASSDAELREFADELRERARNGESLDDLLPECFALVREAGKRALGMRHFDVQLIGGMVLHDGAIAEMRTGEGKTLTGTTAIVLNTLAGRGVHVVTVNDYLAKRDALWMKPLYDFLGVSIGILQNMQPYEEKRAAYAADVTYGTNSEFGFDYLRDNMATTLEEKVQHGGREKPERGSHYHTFAVVDEVDNILIDEARTPLIISGAPEQAADLYVKFARLAPTMVAGKTPEGMDPRTKKEFLADFDYEFDEKYETVAVTEQGVAKAERFLGIDHLYRAENGHLVNHLHQALKAEALKKRDKDYAVIDGDVKIIDEHTGRILEGRRWSEGLHQAVEAKEGVRVQEENQTLASVTLQNYFRKYDKLSGMTGTAVTEATEFMKIYELPVVQIPTNRPMIRKDQNDQVYKTKEGKWAAVIKEIEERHTQGQPVLVGTISVEVSEMLSASLKQRGIQHTVLNAKPEYAQREGEIVAEAGAPGAVTIATNMAGRGVDIKLGGNAEHLAAMEVRAKLGLNPGDPDFEEHVQNLLPALEEHVEALRNEVMDAGGLCIIGTERHESRRIDNQLRGRAGRQGDPGETRFFLSAEDDLVRLFAGDRIFKILDRLGSYDEEGNEEPIEAKMLSNQIEKAQKKVEEQYFLMRKHTLEYDDVLNQQREVIYTYRDEILEGRDMGDASREEIANLIDRLGNEYMAGDFVEDWDVDGLITRIAEIFPPSDGILDTDPDTVDREDLILRLQEEALAQYDLREQELGDELMRALERFLILQIIDQRWREHLHDMDYLQHGIGLRGVAQLDPLVAYKNEAYSLFGDLMNLVWGDFARMIFHVQVTLGPAPGEDSGPQPQAAPPPPRRPSPRSSSSTGGRRVTYSGGTVPTGAQALGAAAAAAGAAGLAEPEEVFGDQPAALEPPAAVETRHVDEEPGRNDPCWCGSGKKFKKCHGA
jgi:preprotein translocase subunit SecA